MTYRLTPNELKAFTITKGQLRAARVRLETKWRSAIPMIAVHVAVKSAFIEADRAERLVVAALRLLDDTERYLSAAEALLEGVDWTMLDRAERARLAARVRALLSKQESIAWEREEALRDARTLAKLADVHVERSSDWAEIAADGCVEIAERRSARPMGRDQMEKVKA